MSDASRGGKSGPSSDRRFSGVARLYGEAAAARLGAAHVCIVGMGGVGSWAVEALARTGVGALTLIDLDMVAESNTNRQIHALGDAYGQAKVLAMAERVRAIHPACRVREIEDFVTPENVAELLAGPFDAVIDAIDQVRAKAAMIAHCRRAGLGIVTAGAAGGQKDPTQIRVDDLARTVQDPLLARLRVLLRREYGFPPAGKKFKVDAVYSIEALHNPPPAPCRAEASEKPGASGRNSGRAGLSCAGFGSSVCVTAAFGFAAAARTMDILIRGEGEEASAGQRSRSPAQTINQCP